ncbi:hypothetical protein NUW54_g6525 [Trametes sanguinea]|uniref:Uncharacterized protein n=1 Tax=Trametes sanguinea TaxID=158606 RepID=A0ACC1PRZ2_9APHY|nr:hypothetical protein NUW54_g6525 [Trametes sanguinea]
MSSVGVRVARTRTYCIHRVGRLGRLSAYAWRGPLKTSPVSSLKADPKKPLQSFYLGIRQALLHKFAPDIEGYQFPRDHDSLRYSDYPSTKIDALLELISYHKGKSCQPPATINDGQVIHSGESIDDWSNWPAVPDAPIDKIIVYLAFPSQNWIIRKALLENGFAFEEIHGRATPSQRVASLKAFQTGSKQVLLMSNVGTVGLNIAFANIVVVMDNLWSAQETEQLMGRVWRHPQEKKVIEYHIVAEGTSDIFIGGISFDKGLAHRRLMHMPTTLRSRKKASGKAKTQVPGRRAIGLSPALTVGDRWPPGGTDLNFHLRTVIVDSLEDGRAYVEGDADEEEDERVKARTKILEEGEWRLGFAIRDLPLGTGREKWLNPLSIEALDFLYMHYQPPHPLDVVITPAILSKYHRMFAFNLRLMRVEIVVRTLFRVTRKTSAPLFPTLTSSNKLLLHFRFVAHGFIMGLSSYVYDVAIGSHMDAFLARLSAASGSEHHELASSTQATSAQALGAR